jgi:serine/threonine-protein kinase SRPK3
VSVSLWYSYKTFDEQPNESNAYDAKFVAVKVLTVIATAAVMGGALGEVDNLKAITKTNPDHIGYKHCLHLYDEFVEKSHYGPHICLVTNVLGRHMPSFRRRQSHGPWFSVTVTKRIVKQTLLSLDYIHRECGLVHTGIHSSFTM